MSPHLWTSPTRRQALAGLASGLSLAVLGPGCQQAQINELFVHAAASLRDVALELAEAFQRSHGVRILFNFAGSNVLAQQIQATGRGDVLLSADLAWLNTLDSAGCLAPQTSRPFLRNRLVVVGHVDNPWSIQAPCELSGLPVSHLAVAHPGAVPAGRYAKAWATSVDCQDGTLWDAFEGRIAPAKDVRAALALVASDPAIVGIVYASDARHSNGVRTIHEPSTAEQPEIVYGAAALAGALAPDHAREFLAFLTSPDQAPVFVRHGMQPVNG